jgi:hypothetical protein
VDDALVRSRSRSTCELAARLLRLSFDGGRTGQGRLWTTADLPRSLARSLVGLAFERQLLQRVYRCSLALALEYGFAFAD